MPGFECIVCSMFINKLTSLEAMTECATLSNTDVDTRATSLAKTLPEAQRTQDIDSES